MGHSARSRVYERLRNLQAPGEWEHLINMKKDESKMIR